MNLQLDDLIHTLSFRVEEFHRQRGQLPGYLWLTINQQGERTFFESEGTPEIPGDASHAEIMAVLRAEQREEFEYDQIERFCVAFPATVFQVIKSSILHITGEEVTFAAVTIEAHSTAAHRLAHRKIVYGSLTELSAIENSRGCFADLIRH